MSNQYRWQGNLLPDEISNIASMRLKCASHFFWRNATFTLGAEAERVAGEPGAGEEGEPVLRPAPRRVEAPVHEHQRRPRGGAATARGRGRRLLGDNLEVEAAGQAVEPLRLPLPERVGARRAEEEGPAPARPCRRPPRAQPHWRRGGEEEGEGGGGGGGRHGHGWWHFW